MAAVHSVPATASHGHAGEMKMSKFVSTKRGANDLPTNDESYSPLRSLAYEATQIMSSGGLPVAMASLSRVS